MTDEHRDRRERLAVDVASAAGPWSGAFADVPRHAFVPDRIWLHDRHRGGAGDLVPLDRHTDPDRWLDAVYTDATVKTQVDDGQPADDGTGWEVTSSTSQPSVMADMLRELDVDVDVPVDVLEIGTGTGWNAALLAHRLGAHRVTTIEVDPAIAAAARTALTRAGYGGVRVLVGDGADGAPEQAPYDRIIATAGVTTVPLAWLAQTRPGGRIVVPLVGTLQSPGVLVLTVHGDGTATGRLAGEAAFMPLRAQRQARPRGTGIDVDTGDVSLTDLHPHWIAGDRSAALVVEMRVPGLYRQWVPGPVDGEGMLWLMHPPTGSWSQMELTTDAEAWTVRQGGPRRLWDDVVAAHRWWVEHDRPMVGDWEWTVGPDGQRYVLRPLVAT